MEKTDMAVPSDLQAAVLEGATAKGLDPAEYLELVLKRGLATEQVDRPLPIGDLDGMWRRAGLGDQRAIVAICIDACEGIRLSQGLPEQRDYLSLALAMARLAAANGSATDFARHGSLLMQRATVAEQDGNPMDATQLRACAAVRFDQAADAGDKAALHAISENMLFLTPEELALASRIRKSLGEGA